ncbi:MAG: helix-turn-helix domain-containing protein [Bacilli bacterium]|nr:helix-turn-helix domain-containing protein [Bacilli bacterium]
MKDLGAYLKRVRVSNGVNIAEAAEDLEISVAELENIEAGNVKAFKDLYDLKDYIKMYSKYLGLDSDKVVDEFNNFLFDHTSKISLDEIKNAQVKEKVEEELNKVRSPYTIEVKEKSYALPIFFIAVLVILIILIAIYVVVNSIHDVPIRVDELLILK